MNVCVVSILISCYPLHLVFGNLLRSYCDNWPSANKKERLHPPASSYEDLVELFDEGFEKDWITASTFWSVLC